MANFKRIGLGVLTTIAVLAIFDVLPNPIPSSLVGFRILGYFYFWPAVGGAIVMFIAAFAGAYVAKVRFVIPAVVLAALFWAFVVYFLNSIAAVAGQNDLISVAGSNILGLIFGCLGAVFGAKLGLFAAGKRPNGATSAA